ncbi:prolyl oligopeptidase family serine peptidase [Qipengyuania gelatinilytica]|uniref:Prolyl oligopeptidase family serine peptidase n=2 Tax=Qipengyuania gelatinilytica TaxID=2867231 RepID=A0ABX9A6G0_9SPHN|nr:prolyl oligopeptidase family serine peptidase [Qipengyuania gelatinilytica]QZD96612.1 prolyl oligopeptidase family serine peptidase [Qipengyuania gelatinilytica]
MTIATPTSLAAQNGVPGPDEDPYIWLEEARSDEALEWVRNENNRTMAHMAQDPRFDELTAEALAILDAEDRVPYVSIRKDGLYNFWQDKQNPKGVLRRTTLESYRTDEPEWEIILDVDALAEAEGKEWVYKGSSCLPPDQRMCMIALSDGGEDATILREFDMTTKQFVEGGFVIEEKSQGGVSWVDENTLLVGRDFGEGTLTESEYPFTTRMWTRGTALADAPEIFRGDAKDVSAGAYLLRTPDGEIQARIAYRGLSFHERAYYLWKDDEWVQLDLPKKAGPYGILDGHMLFSTDVDWDTQGQTFPADSLIAVDLEEWKADPNGATKTLVWAPQERQTKRGGNSTANSAYMSILDNVVGKVLKIDFEDGEWVKREVALPDNATLGVSTASSESDEIMFTSTDFLTPSTLWYTDGSGDPEVLKTSPSYFDASGMEVEQFEATSKDGAKIPYFLVKPKGMEMDGTTPTLLYGYGGFQVSQLPSYRSLTGKMWLEKGGAFILANLRGGGEFGPGWHQSAIRENKQRTWDDFIAVGQDAVKRGITNPGQLGIQGGSQGGLLVGTAFTQAPEAFDAAIVAIPLFDMLRYHLIGRGASWIGEYGDPRIPEQRAWIEGYSPYQKIVEGVDYPAPFLWASTADDRTHPAHARKAAAKLKELGQDYWYFEDMTGGHSGGVDNEQRAKLQALQIFYLMQRLMDDNEAE